MSTTPPQDPLVMPPVPPNSLNAEYADAVAAYQTHVTLIGPIRQTYQDVFIRYKQFEAHHIKVMEDIASHRSTYQRHKQYVISLTNALLHSNTALHTTTITSNVDTHVQVLTQATLVHELQFASETLVKMIMKNKRLDKANNKAYTKEHKFFLKCRDMFKMFNREIAELDRLHANVLEAGAKIGKDADCGKEDGRCIACKRNEAQEARRVEAEKAEAEKVEAEKAEAERAEAERAIVEKRGRIRGRMGKAVLGKQMLDVILEEDESQDGANA